MNELASLCINFSILILYQCDAGHDILYTNLLENDDRTSITDNYEIRKIIYPTK